MAVKYALKAIVMAAFIIYIDSVGFPAIADDNLVGNEMKIVTTGTDAELSEFVRLKRRSLGDNEYYMWLRVICPVREELTKQKYDECVVLQF